MTIYIVRGIVVVGMGIAAGWVFYLKRLEDRHGTKRQRRSGGAL